MHLYIHTKCMYMYSSIQNMLDAALPFPPQGRGLREKKRRWDSTPIGLLGIRVQRRRLEVNGPTVRV